MDSSVLYLARKLAKLQRHARTILRVVDLVEARCMAAAEEDVTPTLLEEMTVGELRKLWRAAKAISQEAK